MKIVVTQSESNLSRATLEVFNRKNNIILKAGAFIGKNGMALSKKEGDKKTPLGQFKLGVAFGMHKRSELKNFSQGLKYFEINENLYWVDDVNSKYYNELVDISKTIKDWKSAEHLIEYQKQYEYAIEIIANPKNIKGNGSAMFLHCSTGAPTSGCVAIPREMMMMLFSIIEENSSIVLKRQIEQFM